MAGSSVPSRRPRRAGRNTWLLVAVITAVAMVAGSLAAAGVFSGSGSEIGAPGRLVEELYPWTQSDGGLPVLTDVTEAWGLSVWHHASRLNFGGPVAIGDVDLDGLADIIVGGDDYAVYFGTGEGFERAAGALSGQQDEVTSIGLGDLDGDGRTDLILGRIQFSDIVVWGGEWTSRRDLALAEATHLSSGEPTTGFAVADLNGDGTNDLLRLGYGSRMEKAAAADVIFEQTAPREFDESPLPGSERLSFAMEAADVDDDGLLDLWITRDLGWIRGADSVYSRSGDADGPWKDIAPSLGVDFEIDGMGVTIADLAGDRRLDVYITDLGENEFVTGTDDGYRALFDHGAARIRPPGSPADKVSSSWGAGVADFNLDGRTDLAIANGGFDGFFNKIENTDVLVTDPPAILLGLGGGRYADVWPQLGVAWTGSSRGLALGDLDNDGDTDIAIVNHNDGLRVYRNDSEGRSLRIRLAQPECTVAGAIVGIRASDKTHRRVLTAHTFLGVHAAEAIVGVGDATSATVTLEIPGRKPVSVDTDLTDERTILELACPPRS